MNFSPVFNNNVSPSDTLGNGKFYSKVMSWVAGSFLSATVGAVLIGPLVPQALMMPLYVVAFIALLVAGFSRKAMQLSGIFAIGVPFILGVILYPTLNYYLSNGMGDIVGLSALGTAIIFGGMAVLGWTSNKNLNHLAPKLFFVLLGLIAMSFLNAFLFQMSILSLVISGAVIVVMSLYTFIDIQRLKNRDPYDQIPAAHYALNIFLNIYNIFVSLLNILGILRN